MPSKKVTIDGVTLEVWEKSFRVIHSSGGVGPLHYIGNDLETAMAQVVDLVRHVREWHVIEIQALTK